ncbi:GntR family transcriptional regulator [Streptomyces sp. NPDC088348]|uniref:GntR family transcriptional regulator n=1 Tax=Streptomyces sp. NPDC088348 TaxID=3365853 RepID=UPI00382BDA42
MKAGERLPSEAKLATRYTVSTPTLRSALAVLQGEGLVEKIHGRGNFVRYPLRRITYVGDGRTSDTATVAPAPLRINVRATQLQARGNLASLLRMPASSPLT